LRSNRVFIAIFLEFQISIFLTLFCVGTNFENPEIQFSRPILYEKSATSVNNILTYNFLSHVDLAPIVSLKETKIIEKNLEYFLQKKNNKKNIC